MRLLSRKTKRVSKKIYANATRAERAEIAAKLAEIKAFELETRPIRERFEARLKALDGLPRLLREQGLRELESEYEPIARLLSPPQIPVSLMACYNCRRPTGRCICKTPDGKPLDWREGVVEAVA